MVLFVKKFIAELPAILYPINKKNQQLKVIYNFHKNCKDKELQYLATMQQIQV